LLAALIASRLLLVSSASTSLSPPDGRAVLLPVFSHC
jgi:hypothetical protein